MPSSIEILEETMKSLLVAGFLSAALIAPACAEDASTPAVSDGTTNPDAPVAGANSFTEEQAREQIAKAGYAGVSALVKDENGIWRGKATKDGATHDVQVDFQGNVTSK